MIRIDNLEILMLEEKKLRSSKLQTLQVLLLKNYERGVDEEQHQLSLLAHEAIQSLAELPDPLSPSLEPRISTLLANVSDDTNAGPHILIASCIRRSRRSL